MKRVKPKISPTEFAKIKALFDIDENVEKWKGSPWGEVTEGKLTVYEEVGFLIDGPMVNSTNDFEIESWHVVHREADK